MNPSRAPAGAGGSSGSTGLIQYGYRVPGYPGSGVSLIAVVKLLDENLELVSTSDASLADAIVVGVIVHG